jgi:phosphoglycerol transferase MdoB-like AlkP superfamily enzyme
MSAAGYHTVYAAPGTRRTPEDWKAYYNYDEYLIKGTMGWNGPFISFGDMSDQYFLDFVGRRYAEMEQPFFLTALLVSSHVPFVRIPEYFEDWDLLGDGTIYQTEGIRKFNNNWLTGSEYPEGYVYSIEYVMKTILGYIERYVDDDALVVIVGDHQPRIPISETTATSGVPLHFLSRSAPRLEPLYSRGLTPGFVPEDSQDLRPMEDFPDLLNAVLQPAGALSQYMQRFR